MKCEAPVCVVLYIVMVLFSTILSGVDDRMPINFIFVFNCIIMYKYMMCEMTCESCLCVGVYIVTFSFCTVFYGTVDILGLIKYPDRKSCAKIYLYLESYEHV